MSRDLFVTGGTGFVGRRTVSLLADRAGAGVVCLVRPRRRGRAAAPLPAGVRVVEGDLTRSEPWEAELARCGGVLHLAAATGRASRRDFRRVNLEGTRALVEACLRNGSPKLFHVSTVAVHYENVDAYPYAATKARAERVVRKCGLEHAIVRPTMVLGGSGHAWRSLATLARCPVRLVPGDGTAVVQPIHVDDVARVLADLTVRDDLPEGAHDLGGPEALPVEELLSRIRDRFGVGGPRRAFHVPLGPVKALVDGLERLLPFPPPIVPGQLSAFERDGRVREGVLQERVRDSLMDVDATIESCLRDRAADAGGRTRG